MVIGGCSKAPIAKEDNSDDLAADRHSRRRGGGAGSSAHCVFLGATGDTVAAPRMATSNQTITAAITTPSPRPSATTSSKGCPGYQRGPVSAKNATSPHSRSGLRWPDPSVRANHPGPQHESLRGSDRPTNPRRATGSHRGDRGVAHQHCDKCGAAKPTASPTAPIISTDATTGRQSCGLAAGRWRRSVWAARSLRVGLL